jgi:hypothetical protein
LFHIQENTCFKWTKIGNKLTFKLVIEPKYRGELRFGTPIGLSK